MADLLVAPENETFPHRKRWTRQECYRLMEEGTLTGRWELIDGEILSKMGQNPPHRITLMLMKQWLKALFGFLNVQTEKPISIPGPAGRTNEPEPDIAVTTAPTTAYTDRHPAPQDLLLVVEVSDSTLRFDLTTKALLYAQVGIQEYWVADIEGRRLHCHRGPTPTGYSEVVVYEEAQQVSPLSRPDAPIGCGDLLPPQTV